MNTGTPSSATGVPRTLTPVRVHLASLVVGFAVLMVLGRSQWFFFDDWAFLHPGADLWAAHVGHWSTAPTLLFQALRATVGFHSYLPYLACAFLAHLAVVHLLWRIALRAGVRPWWATALAAASIVLGSAAENLFWAFQVGFMGAIALALLVVLLLDRAIVSVRVAILAGALAVVASTFSGTAIPVLVGAAIVGWIRRGPLRTAAVLAPAAVIYAIWYLLEARGQYNPLGLHGIDVITRGPVYFAAIFAAGYGEFTGLVVAGPVVAIGLLIWVFRARRRWLGREAIAYVLLISTVVFAALTALSRGGGGIESAGAQRYVYVIVMLAVPTIGLALSAVAGRGRILRFATMAVVIAVAAVNVVLGVLRADAQANVEQAIEREFSAAIVLVEKNPDAYPPGAMPLRVTAPDLTVSDVRADVDAGLVSPIPFTARDLRKVENSLAGR